MYDVTEEVQGKVDAYAAATTAPHHGSGDSKSSYLEIRPSEDVTAWLGDPAPGQDKWLQLHYYVLPQGSSVTFTARYQYTHTHTVGDWYLTHHTPCTMHTLTNRNDILTQKVTLVGPIIEPRLCIVKATMVFD